MATHIEMTILRIGVPLLRKEEEGGLDEGEEEEEGDKCTRLPNSISPVDEECDVILTYIL